MHQLMHPVYAELTRLINTCINYASYMSQFRLISANRKGTSHWTHIGSHCLNYAVVTKFKLNLHSPLAVLGFPKATEKEYNLRLLRRID